MSTNPSSTIITERVDDIPLLLVQLEKMGVPQRLDAHFPTHGNWIGLSLGWTTTIWLVHIRIHSGSSSQFGSRLGCSTSRNPKNLYRFTHL